MPTSGVTTYTIDLATLIKDAYLELGVIGFSDTPTQDETNLATRRLNQLIRALQADYIFINQIDKQEISTVADDNSYPIAAGTRRLLYAWLNINGNDIPLQITSIADFDKIVTKGGTGQPTHVCLDGELKVYPVPNAVYKIQYRREALLDSFVNTTDEADVPAAAIRMLVLGLASSLAGPARVDAAKKAEVYSEFNNALLQFKAGNTYRSGQEIVNSSPFVV